MKIQVAGKKEDSLVNGEGMRFVLFVSGCKHNCEGCHNKEMQNFLYGDTWDTNDIFNIIKENISYIDGVTFSGGEPLEQSEALIDIAKRIKNELGLNIWCYTGYVLEDVLSGTDNSKKELLQYVDVLVDGKFDNSKTKDALYYTGSSNQRIINLNNSNYNK